MVSLFFIFDKDCHVNVNKSNLLPLGQQDLGVAVLDTVRNFERE